MPSTLQRARVGSIMSDSLKSKLTLVVAWVFRVLSNSISNFPHTTSFYLSIKGWILPSLSLATLPSSLLLMLRMVSRGVSQRTTPASSLV